MGFALGITSSTTSTMTSMTATVPFLPPRLCLCIFLFAFLASFFFSFLLQMSSLTCNRFANFQYLTEAFMFSLGRQWKQAIYTNCMTRFSGINLLFINDIVFKKTTSVYGGESILPRHCM